MRLNDNYINYNESELYWTQARSYFRFMIFCVSIKFTKSSSKELFYLRNLDANKSAWRCLQLRLFHTTSHAVWAGGRKMMRRRCHRHYADCSAGPLTAADCLQLPHGFDQRLQSAIEFLKLKKRKGRRKNGLKKITYQADWSSTFPVTFRGELALVGGDGCLPGISA